MYKIIKLESKSFAHIYIWLLMTGLTAITSLSKLVNILLGTSLIYQTLDS